MICLPSVEARHLLCPAELCIRMGEGQLSGEGVPSEFGGVFTFSLIERIIEKAREFQRNIYFCFIDYTKAFVWITTNCGIFLKRWEYRPPEKSV